MAEASTLTNMAYSAALDGALWRPLAERLAVEMRAQGGIFVVLDSHSLSPRRFESSLRLEGVGSEYTSDGWWQFDPQIPQACGLVSNAVYSDVHRDVEVSDALRAYRDWEASWGSVFHLTSVGLLDPTGTLRACFSCHYGKDGPSAAAFHRMSGLLPELAKALELGFKHEQALSTEYWRGIASQDRSQALLLIDEYGAIAELNQAALCIVQAGDGISVIMNRLICSEPSCDSALQALIRKAIASEASSGAVRLARPSSRSPYVVTIFPLERTRRALAPYEAAALVRIIDGSQTPTPRALYKQAFGLTDREADLAIELMKGHSSETASAVLGIATATARIHLRRLFDKTGARRQSDLVRLLGRII